MKEKILWISPYAPYDSVRHAGGKVHNYYVKSFHKSGLFDITLLSLCLKEEEKFLDLDKYGIKNHIYVMDQTKWKQFERRATSAWSYVNPYDKYAGVCLDYERKKILELLKAYKKEGEIPDIVMLQWTFSVMLTPVIRKYFPDSKIIDIEEDVTFLGYQRKWEQASGGIQKWFWKKRYQKIHTLELERLKEGSLIVTNNPKDTKLLIDSGIQQEKIFTSVPYFDKYTRCVRSNSRKDILFIGAMNRPENYKSALWFIDEVMPVLEEEGFRFLVIGGNPPAELLRKASEKIQIKGYVENILPYLEQSLCFAAPLLFGAGIKIKVLEAMSAGIPVLTNEVGIEGIPAENDVEYILCEKKEDYINAVRRLAEDQEAAGRISRMEKEFIKREYHLEARTQQFIEKVK